MPGDGQPARQEEVGLGRFHESEEVGEVHDPCHVGVAEIDTAFGREGDHHEGSLEAVRQRSNTAIVSRAMVAA